MAEKKVVFVAFAIEDEKIRTMIKVLISTPN